MNWVRIKGTDPFQHVVENRVQQMDRLGDLALAGGRRHPQLVLIHRQLMRNASPGRKRVPHEAVAKYHTGGEKRPRRQNIEETP